MLLEADVKKAVSDYLQIGMNQGRWFFMRLNAGSFILQNPDGSYRRRVKGVEKGTADYVVFQQVSFSLTYTGRLRHSLPPIPATRVTYLECKSSTGKQSPEQGAFEIMVKMFNCRYYIVRDANQLEELLK